MQPQPRERRGDGSRDLSQPVTHPWQRWHGGWGRFPPLAQGAPESLGSTGLSPPAAQGSGRGPAEREVALSGQSRWLEFIWELPCREAQAERRSWWCALAPLERSSSSPLRWGLLLAAAGLGEGKANECLENGAPRVNVVPGVPAEGLSPLYGQGPGNSPRLTQLRRKPPSPSPVPLTTSPALRTSLGLPRLCQAHA